MLGRTNAGGGGSGGTLTVTGVAGDTVTVSKDGKTYSRTFNSSGIATFKGLKSGKWTVTMTGSSGTATRTVEISADYELTMAYFSATINVTYPSGSAVTVTDGTTTLPAPDTSGTWACVVPNAGTWTVTATNGTQTKSLAVSITAEGQVETVTLGYTLHIIQAGVIQASGLSSYIKGTNRLLKLVQNEGSITLKNHESYSYNGYRLSDVAIDLSAYDTLYCTGYQASPKLEFGLSTAIGSGSSDADWVGGTVFAATSTTKSYDVSGVTGAYYVGFHTNGSLVNTATVTDLWLE